jgi:hypothetical protein
MIFSDAPFPDDARKRYRIGGRQHRRQRKRRNQGIPGTSQ